MFGIQVDHHAEASVTKQLCSQLRELIEVGELIANTRLPSTRKFAKEYKIARNVVIDAYEQLIAEGYLESKTGSGTYVANGIQTNLSKENNEIAASITYSSHTSLNSLIHFAAATPNIRDFPKGLWAKYMRMAIEDTPAEIHGYADFMGDQELREALCTYLFRMKDMRCHPEQIMITSGSSDGFLLIANALQDTYHSIYIEDPTVSFTQNIFKHMNYQLHPLAVDHQGVNIDSMKCFDPGHLALITPAHQYPIGSVLPVQRRQKIIEMATKSDSFIIEDDYDSEFRFKGIPIPPLQTLQPERVILVGTFSKILAPDLRLGFLVLPHQLVDRFMRIKSRLYIRTSSLQERALAWFIADGHLDRHIYKMKKKYRKRRALLIDQLNKYFGDDIIIKGDEAGMHLLVEFKPKRYETIDWNNSISYGIKINPIEQYEIQKGHHKREIVLGYGNLEEKEIILGVEKLYSFIQDWSTQRKE